MMGLFSRNRKGMSPLAMVISFLVLIFLAYMILRPSEQSIKGVGDVADKALQCSGAMAGQNMQGTCLPEAECMGTKLPYGCTKNPGTVCCIDSQSSQNQALAACTGRWNDCSKCKVKLTALELRPQSPKLNQDFKVVCKTSIQDAPCVKVEVTSDKSTNVGYCDYVTGQPIHTTERVFNCPGRYFNDPAKTYTLTCVLLDTGTKDNACCIDEPSVEGNAKRSISIKLE